MSSTKRRMLVIGGVAAGMSAASKARRTNAELEIVVFERGDWISYSACGLPYFVGGLVERHEQLLARTVGQFASQRVDVRLRHRVVAINPDRRTVTVQPEAERGRPPVEERYDALLLAMGATPTNPSIDGADLDGVFNLYVMNDALRIRGFVEQYQPKRAVIVGGGYIGLEMAENLARLGIKIAVVQRPPRLFSSVDNEIADLIAGELERQGVDLSLCDSVVRACSGSDGRVECVDTNQGQLAADIVLFATGTRPTVDLARAAGVRIGETGAIAVDAYQRTNIPGVYAAGDCAEHFHRVAGRPFWVPLGTTANKQGRIAGENIGGGDVTFKGIVGTAITRAFELEIGRTGLSARDAELLGYDVVSEVVDYSDIAGYYPDPGSLRVKLVAERGSGRLLGGQAIGTGGVDKRIDVLATALHANMTVDDLAWLDLGYAPPFNSVWDPVHVAASNLLKKL